MEFLTESGSALVRVKANPAQRDAAIQICPQGDSLLATGREDV